MGSTLKDGGGQPDLRGRIRAAYSRLKRWAVHHKRLAIAIAAASAVIVVAIPSFLAGFVGGKYGPRVADGANFFLSHLRGEITHEKRETGFHTLDVARLPVSQAWSLAEVDGHILFASRLGKLGYLTGGRVAPLDLDIPIGFKAYESSQLAQHTTMSLAHIRVTDLLAIEIAQHEYELYAAHLKYDKECMRLVVSRVGLTADEAVVKPRPGGWREIFRAKDCIGPRSAGPPFVGLQSGGRLVRFGPHTITLSVGDFEYIGIGAPGGPPSSDPSSDLGKVLLIDTSTGESKIYASGLRNPEGLMIASDGSMWETEHGPRGGDELNRIMPNVDYGWPHVTYGASYILQPAPPLRPDTQQGTADGYERPRFAFIPSIGVSNLIEPDPIEFPRWDRHLLVASLKGAALRLLRLEGDNIVSDEPIEFPGNRIRDIISLADGRIAFSVDQGDIFIVSNVDRSTDRPRIALLAGLKELGAPAEKSLSKAQQQEMAFTNNCGQCHSVAGEAASGPPLNGLLGRRIGGVPGYPYSAALAKSSGHWTKDRLSAFLEDVEGTFPGTHMPQPGDPNALTDIVAFLSKR